MMQGGNSGLSLKSGPPFPEYQRGVGSPASCMTRFAISLLLVEKSGFGRVAGMRDREIVQQRRRQIQHRIGSTQRFHKVETSSGRDSSRVARRAARSSVHGIATA